MSLEKVYSVDSKRPLAHAGILIDKNTWNEAHNFHLNRLSLHAMTMHKPGVVGGLEVFAEPACRSILINAKVVEEEGEAATIVPEPRQVPLYKLENKAIAVTPDGGKVITGLRDGTIRVWSLQSDTEERTIEAHELPVTGVAISPDGRRIISGSEDGSIRVWDIESGAQELILTGSEAPVASVTITPNGRNVVGGSADGSIRVWNLRSGEEERVMTGHGGPVVSVAATPDGKQLVTGSNDRSVRVWDLDSGAEQKTLAGHRGGVRSVAVTPDGRYVVTGSSDRSVRVWELNSDDEGAAKVLTGHDSPVTGVAITPDGNRAISVSEDASVRVWNIEAGVEEQALTGHSGSVNSITITPDGKHAVSGSDDGSLRVWNLEAGSLIFVNQGTAVDGCGTVISMPEPSQVSLESLRDGAEDAASDTVYILLSHTEVDSDEPEMIVTHQGERLPKYGVRNFNIHVDFAPPTEQQVELARIRLKGQSLKITDAENPYDPRENEVDLRFRYPMESPPLGEIGVGVLTLAMTEEDIVADHIHGISKLVQAINNLTPYKAYLKRLDDLDESSLEDCHLVLMTGQKEFGNSLNETHQSVLREFLDRGGILLGENCSSNGKDDEGFTRDFNNFSRRGLGHAVVAGMSPDIDVLTSYYTFSATPEGIVPEPNGFVNVSRDITAIQSTRDYGCIWGGQVSNFQRDFIRTATEFGVNLAVYSYNRIQNQKARQDLGLVL